MSFVCRFKFCVQSVYMIWLFHCIALCCDTKKNWALLLICGTSLFVTLCILIQLGSFGWREGACANNGSLYWSIYLQEDWINVGLDFPLSFWLIETVTLTFLKQVFLEVVFVLDGSEIIRVKLSGFALSAENILKSLRCLNPCRSYKCWQQQTVNLCIIVTSALQDTLAVDFIAQKRELGTVSRLWKLVVSSAWLCCLLCLYIFLWFSHLLLLWFVPVVYCCCILVSPSLPLLFSLLLTFSCFSVNSLPFLCPKPQVEAYAAGKQHNCPLELWKWIYVKNLFLCLYFNILVSVYCIVCTYW